MKIVILDAETIGKDIDLSIFEELGELVVFEKTTEDQTADRIKDADVVVTGEGCLDGQSVMGKAPVGVAKLAKKYNKKVIAFSGCIGNGAEACNEAGIDAYFPILQKPCGLQEAMETDNAYVNLKSTATQVFKLL